jgi:hypothetical protein
LGGSHLNTFPYTVPPLSFTNGASLQNGICWRPGGRQDTDCFFLLSGFSVGF